MRGITGDRIALAISALLMVAGSEAGYAARIDWETSGAFQTCLEGRAQRWIDAKVELVVSDNPAAGDVDDAAVASWTLQALDACKTQTGRSDPASEQQFVRYMAHWREHSDAEIQA
jgi:hypothetical protein